MLTTTSSLVASIEKTMSPPPNTSKVEQQKKVFSFDKLFQEKSFFVYIDWTTEETKRAFYIGYGGKNRIGRKKRNNHHTNIMKKYGFKREIVFTTLDENNAKQLEIELISKYRTYVYSEHYVFGANYTVGGDGSRGHKQPPCSEEHKRILSEVNSHPKNEDTKALMKIAAQNRANNPEWRQKMSDVSKKRWEDENYRLKLSKATTGKKRSEEFKKKMSARMRGKKLSEETKRKISKALKGRRPKNLEQLQKNNIGKKRTKETRRKISEAAKKRKGKRGPYKKGKNSEKLIGKRK